MKQAEAIRVKIEDLIAAAAGAKVIEGETARWLAGISDTLHRRLARAGLVEPRVKQDRPKLGAFLDSYLQQRVDVKPGTMLVLKQARRTLARIMGEGKAVDQVSPADADTFRAALLGEGLARATVNKWCQYARHFFEVAKRRRMIHENPFGHIKGAVRGNAARRVFIKTADVLRVIDAASDPQWKLLIALARIGGLRIPSEALTLRWADVDMDNKRFTIRSSKTEHHDGGGVRVVPMFPELVPLFEKVLPDAAEGHVHVISRYRDPAANLRTQLVRYIAAAGLTPWPKPWQNLRASRATELADKYPSHVCAAWLGHTEAVADEFYRQVTDEHYAKAVATGAAQNPAQYAAESSSTEPEAVGAETQNHRELPGDSESHDLVQVGEVGAVGFEPTKA